MLRKLLSAYVPVIIALGFAICLLKIGDIGHFRRFAASGVLLLASFAAIIPWTIHNYRATGEFILVNDGFSYNLWLGSLPETIRLYEGGFKTTEENQQFADRIWGSVQREKLAELEQTDAYSSLSYNERERVWRREAMRKTLPPITELRRESHGEKSGHIGRRS
jgi:hypothetical protein